VARLHRGAELWDSSPPGRSRDYIVGLEIRRLRVSTLLKGALVRFTAWMAVCGALRDPLMRHHSRLAVVGRWLASLEARSRRHVMSRCGHLSWQRRSPRHSRTSWGRGPHLGSPREHKISSVATGVDRPLCDQKEAHRMAKARIYLAGPMFSIGDE